jgi:hypothetical protein
MDAQWDLAKRNNVKFHRSSFSRVVSFTGKQQTNLRRKKKRKKEKERERDSEREQERKRERVRERKRGPD